MKILQIHTCLKSGGIEAMICNLSNEMANLGHDVTVCSIYEPKAEDVFWDRFDSKVKRITIGKKSKGFSLKTVWDIFVFICRGHYDVVNIHGFFYYYVLAVFLLFRRSRFFYTIHSDAVREIVRWDKHIFFLRKFAFRHKLVRPITISNESQRSFRMLYGFDGQLIYNGIPKPVVQPHLGLSDEFHITPLTKVFFHPGRITIAKNQLVLVRVFSRLIQEGHDIVLVIAGNNDNHTIFSEISPYFSDRIRYIGITDHVPQFMSEADAFCLSSIFEGLPVTLLESLAVGCIPICSPVGGIPELVNDGTNGLLSRDSSFEAYYDTVKRFLALPETARKEMKEHAKASFLSYTIENTALQYISFYQSTL